MEMEMPCSAVGGNMPEIFEHGWLEGLCTAVDGCRCAVECGAC